MITTAHKIRKLILASLSAVCLTFSPVSAQEASQNNIETISFSHVPCGMKEFSDRHLHFNVDQAADCPDVGQPGSTSHGVLTIKSGTYDLVVSNESVPWAVGIWIRAKNPMERVILPSLSMNKMNMGQMTERRLTLPAGEYLVSCPYNKTPDYLLIVEP